MKTIDHNFKNASVSRIARAISAAWDVINHFGAGESELNARTRYAVSEQIAAEFDILAPVAVEELAKNQIKQSHRDLIAQDFKSYKKVTATQDSWLLVSCTCKGQNASAFSS